MSRLSLPSAHTATITIATLCLALLSACDTMPAIPGMSKPAATSGATSAATSATTATTASTPAHAASAAPAASGLADGIAMYNKGDYNGAIRRLGQPDLSGPATPRATQTAALKYSAFSYCLTARQAQCRQQFDKALKIDPAFDLEAGEHGHPLWEPVFAKAKKGLK